MLNTGAKTFSTLMVALVLFGLAGSAVMVAVPGFFAGPLRPGFTVFLLTGEAAIVLTAGLFGYIYCLAWASAGRSWCWPPATTP